MIKFYKIELYQDNLLGYITFNLNNNKINISYIHINQPGKKYGSFLLLIFSGICSRDHNVSHV